MTLLQIVHVWPLSPAIAICISLIFPLMRMCRRWRRPRLLFRLWCLPSRFPRKIRLCRALPVSVTGRGLMIWSLAYRWISRIPIYPLISIKEIRCLRLQRLWLRVGFIRYPRIPRGESIRWDFIRVRIWWSGCLLCEPLVLTDWLLIRIS